MYLPEDVVEDVEGAVLRVQCEGLGELKRLRAVVDGEGAGDEDDERVAVSRGLGVARLDLVLHLLEWKALQRLKWR